MFQSVKQLFGEHIAALDGEIGQVKDFYFDDRSWAVRYLEIEAGSWLTGRCVLLSPGSLGCANEAAGPPQARLTLRQIEASPPAGAGKAPTRHLEEEYCRYYGWPHYWEGDAMWDRESFPMLGAAPGRDVPPKAAAAPPKARPLRSVKAVDGFKFHAADGRVGYIDDFLIDPETWRIGLLNVRTGLRFSYREVRVPTESVVGISDEESAVYTRASSVAVAMSPLE